MSSAPAAPSWWSIGIGVAPASSIGTMMLTHDTARCTLAGGSSEALNCILDDCQCNMKENMMEGDRSEACVKSREASFPHCREVPVGGLTISTPSLSLGGEVRYSASSVTIGREASRDSTLMGQLSLRKLRRVIRKGNSLRF